MMSSNIQFKELSKHIRMKQTKRIQLSNVRTINIFKWKNIMLQTIDALKRQTQYDQLLLDDIKVVIMKIPQENYIEAILNMQPYRPNFKVSTYKVNNTIRRNKVVSGKRIAHLIDKDTVTQSSRSNFSLKTNGSEQLTASRKINASEQMLTILIEEQYLSHQLSSLNHPFSKVIDGTTYLLENKYKSFVQKIVKIKGVIQIEEVCTQLSRDVLMIEFFFKLAAKPLVDLFSAYGRVEHGKVSEDISNFIVTFIRNNSKFVISLRKILRFASRKSRQVQLFQLNSPIDTNINKYDIPEELKIEGCYILTTHQLLQFSNTTSGKDALFRLSNIRQAFFKDIDQYIKINGGKRGEVTSDAQLDIFKFLLGKLRIFAAQIQAQLLLLEALYGQEEISFYYDASSYIHSQLSVAFEAIRLNI